MSVMWADDFKGYGTDKALMLDGLYGLAYITLSEDPDPNISGLVVAGVVTTANGTVLRRVFPNTRTTVGVGYRLWLVGLPPIDKKSPISWFCDGLNNKKIGYYITTTGGIAIVNSGLTTVGVSSGPVVTANAWNHIEFKATANAATGSVEIRVNGVPVATAGSLDTGTEFSQWRIDGGTDSGGFFTYYVKDLVAWDSTGSANNSFLGAVSVLGRTPNADVDFNWTPSTGTTGYNLLDNSPPLDGSEYISAAYPPPDPSVFALASLPDDITVVKALITQIRVRKSDGGEGNVQSGIISDASTDTGVDRPVTTAFTYYEDVFDRDPDGDVAWTPLSADAATLQINRTA